METITESRTVKENRIQRLKRSQNVLMAEYMHTQDQINDLINSQKIRIQTDKSIQLEIEKLESELKVLDKV